MDQVDALRREAEAGDPASAEGFAESARGVLEATPKQLRPVVDAALEAVFVEHLDLLQQRLFERFEGDRRPATALERADRQFVSSAKELVCPGANWTYAPERAALLESLAQVYRQDAAIRQERARSAQTMRATTAVVGKLQKQMEQLGEKINGASGPWALWTSYRIPGTPLRMSGRYQSGRTNIELSLAPNKDPANAEAGFVEGLTWSNMGLALNVGV